MGAANYDFEISQSIIDKIHDTDKMRPLFDQKVSKDRVGDELNKMFRDKKGGLKALGMMTDLGVLENYVTLMCEPSANKIPDYCFLIGKFMEEDTVSIVDDSLPSLEDNYANYDITYNDDEISQWTKAFEVKVVAEKPVIDYKKLVTD